MSARFCVLQVAPTLDTGGVERTTIEVAEAITAAGGKALVASRGGRMEDDLAHVGGELIRMPVASKNPLTVLANAERLTHVARAREVSLIHARSRAPAWSALMAARRTALPFVTTYHGIYSALGPVKRAYNSVMAKGDLVIANSEFAREHILSVHGADPARVVTIPRGVDLALFDPANVESGRVRDLREAWGVKPAELVALVPARLSRWKGQDLLIEAVALMAARTPRPVRYVLAGDPQGRADYVAALDEAIAAHALSEQIVRAGHIADMPAAFAAADFAIFASTNLEAFGRGAVEAQAMGVPVIAPQQGGFTETVAPNETGLLFAMGEAPDLANALLRMLSLPDDVRSAMGANAKTRARALYSKQALQRATLEIYRRLLHNETL